MAETVDLQLRDEIAIITVDRPPVNAIDVSVRAGICSAIDDAEATADVKAIILICAGRTFMSGAELSEFDGPVAEPGFAETLDRLEKSSRPIIAAMHGMALGGGLETAMACHYRCATASARMGMPEITLGLVPGGGGTQRLPRLVGARRALEMLISGKPVTAADALESGLIDRIVDGDLLKGAISYAETLIAEGAARRPTRDHTVDTAGFSQDDIDSMLVANARFLKGRTTQIDMLKAVKAAAEKPFDQGLEIEKELSANSLDAPESIALRHVFFAERKAAKIPGLATDTGPLEISRVAVIGAGTMGGGIAMALSNAGLPVTLIDAKEEALARGQATIRKNYNAAMKRGRLTPEQVEECLARITGALDLQAAANADLVIEAVFEDMELKKSILSQLDSIVPAYTILASNTSTLSITELGAVTGRPDKVVGLHFFSPAHIMRLLEIVRGEETSPLTLVTCLRIAKRIKKIGVVAGDGFGFIGNRMMLDGYFREAEQLLLEGATPEQIDRVMENFGFAMGPNRVNDMAGVDIGTVARKELLKREARPAPYFPVSDSLTAMGRLGQKTGKGIYKYKDGDRTAYPDPEVTDLIARLAAEYDIDRGQISDAEIEERCILPLINIGAEILEEGAAYRASDIDVVWTSGYGFPRHLGGPMAYGDRLGLDHVLGRVTKWYESQGHYWQPAPLLIKLAGEGKTFADWDREREEKETS